MGAAAACELAREGASVALIDQSTLPNPQAASFDHSKVFRLAYPDRFYVSLAVDALKRWQALEDETATKLFTRSGALLIGKHRPSFETQCYDAVRSLSLDAEMLDRDQVAARFPQFNVEAFSYGVFDPTGAILHSEAALRAMIDLAKRRGVEVIENRYVTRVERSGSSVVVKSSGSDFEFDCAMMASGPWARKLLPFLSSKLTTTRQEIVYFKPAKAAKSFEPGVFPIFLEMDSGFYGFPIHNAGAMKIANHHKGAEVDPDFRDDRVDERFIESCRGFFAEFIPALADASVTDTRVCVYNNTPDDDFIIDWHPQLERVLIVSGFSGHGFKFGPAIGRIASELLLSNRTTHDIDRFRIDRLM